MDAAAGRSLQAEPEAFGRVHSIIIASLSGTSEISMAQGSKSSLYQQSSRRFLC
jgi:hypothetical protein